MKRVAYLDGIRGIAISAVVLTHYYGGTYAPFLPYGDRYSTLPIISEGGTGVQLFFLVSGFVILLTLDKCQSFSEFLGRRLLRLWPAMVLACIAILAFNTMPFARPQASIGFVDLLPSLTFVSPSFYHAAFHHDFHNLDDVFWSLDVEMGFYLFFGMLYFRLGAFRAILVLIAVATFTTLLHGHRFNEPLEWLGFQYFAWFAAGALFYRGAFWPAVIVGMFAAFMAQSPAYTIGQRLAFFVAVAIFAIAQRFRFAQSLLANRALLFVGFISYPLYLVHARIGVGILSSLKGTTPLLAIVPLIPVVLISWLCARYWEPFARDRLRLLRAPLQAVTDRAKALPFSDSIPLRRPADRADAPIAIEMVKPTSSRSPSPPRR